MTRSLMAILCATILMAFLFVTAQLVSETFPDRSNPVWLRMLCILGGLLLAIGAIGFFGTFLSGFGGLNWLPGSFEWPVGYASGVASMPNGDHIVPLTAADRIQLYDPRWRFLSGWHVDASGGEFVLRASPGDRIEVFTARNKSHQFFTLDGTLISSDTYSDEVGTFNSVSARNSSCFVATPLWLWTFTGPFYSLAMVFWGGALLVFTKAKSTIVATPPVGGQSALRAIGGTGKG